MFFKKNKKITYRTTHKAPKPQDKHLISDFICTMCCTILTCRIKMKTIWKKKKNKRKRKKKKAHYKFEKKNCFVLFNWHYSIALFYRLHTIFIILLFYSILQGTILVYYSKILYSIFRFYITILYYSASKVLHIF